MRLKIGFSLHREEYFVYGITTLLVDGGGFAGMLIRGLSSIILRLDKRGFKMELG